jgi:polar amino acid transport system permease protein
MDLAAWFKQLYATTGINLTIAYDPFDRARFLHGLLVTIELSAITIVASIVIGVIGAWLQGSRLVWTRRIVAGYIQFFRNTPSLAQLYFLFFGLSSVLPVLIGGFTWVCISLSFFAGSFNVEIFRSGIEAVPRATIEAAESLGYTRLKAYTRIVLPLAIRVCLPALNNNLINLVKATTLAYAVAVPELLYVSAQIWSDNTNVPEMMVVLLVVYAGLVGLLVVFMHALERRLRLPGYHRPV